MFRETDNIEEKKSADEYFRGALVLSTTKAVIWKDICLLSCFNHVGFKEEFVSEVIVSFHEEDSAKFVYRCVTRYFSSMTDSHVLILEWKSCAES